MRRWLAPAAVIVALLVIWELAARWDLIADALQIKPFLIPAPSDVADSLWTDRSLLAEDAWVTAQEVLLGFALALALGFGFAVVLHLSDTLRRAFYPLLVASQTVPMIAIAPILIVWLGFGLGPKLAIIALVCFFPITVNTLDGLRSVDPELPRMMRTLDAGRGRILSRVEIPSALPYLLSGAKIAAAISVIGAVFGEWAGADRGPRPPDPDRPGSAADRARVRRRGRALGAGPGAVRGPGADRAPLRLVEPEARPRRGAVSGRLAAALLAATLVVAIGCGEKQERAQGDSERLTLALDFYVNPDHAGIYTALDRGLFEEAGLEVEPQVPSDPSAPIRQVAAGRADLAISYEPEVLLAQDEGLPVIAVAALVSQPLTSLISLPEAGIEDAADLEGKTIATAGIPYQADYLDAILDREGLSLDDVEQKDVGLNLLPAVLSGSADAMLGGFLNIEGVDLAERGLDPRVVPVDELGIPTYDELVLVANTDRVADDPEAIRLFIAALERGTRAAADDPAARDRGGAGGRRRARAEADPGRDRRHPAAAAAGPGAEAVRLHGRRRVGRVRRLLRRPRADLEPPPGIRHVHRRAAAGEDPAVARVRRMDFKLELIAVPVSDVDRAKAFYTENCGFNADHDHQVTDQLRFVQLTPPGSACSISIGDGITEAEPGSLQGLQLVVDDIEAAREELAGRGVEVSEVQSFDWGAFVFFADPDGNRWAVQQIPDYGA